MSERERERTPEDEQDERDERIMALVARGVKRFMHEQQQGLLHTAAKNSQAIVNTEIEASSSKVRDTIDEGLEKVQEYEDIKWKSKINKNNFDFARQVNELWEKTERAATEEKPDRVKELCQKGKKIAKQRMKVLRLADKDGLGTAFEYLSDDLADDEQDRKRMKKAKKSAEAKEKAKVSATTYAKNKVNSGSYGDRQGSNRSEAGRAGRDSRTCWACGRSGHTARYCPRETNRPQNSYDTRRY